MSNFRHVGIIIHSLWEICSLVWEFSYCVLDASSGPNYILMSVPLFLTIWTRQKRWLLAGCHHLHNIHCVILILFLTPLSFHPSWTTTFICLCIYFLLSVSTSSSHFASFSPGLSCYLCENRTLDYVHLIVVWAPSETSYIHHNIHQPNDFWYEAHG